MTDARAIPLRAKLLVAVFGLGVAAVLCEVGARAMFPAPPTLGREPQLRFQMDPDVGFVHVPSQTGYLDDGLATVNALGLRGPLPRDPKPDGARRILAIGDSTTFGWGVDDEDAYPAQLEARLTAGGEAVQVVNGGVSAYDLKQAASLLRRIEPALCPDVVLVGLFWNDLPYQNLSPSGEVLRGGPRVGRDSSAPMPVRPAAASTFQMANQPTALNGLLRRSRLAFALRHAWLKVLAPTGVATNQVQWEMALLQGRPSAAIDAAWQDIGETLAEIRAMAVEGGYAVGVVIIPIRAQVEGDYPNAAYQTRVRALAEPLGMFVVDPLPRLRAAVDRTSLFIPYDRMHLTAEGNSLIADEVFEVITHRPEFQFVGTSGPRRMP